MKNLLLFIACFGFLGTSYGQVTLEHTYPVENYFDGNNLQREPWFVGITKLSQGDKYTFVDTSGANHLYNMDHSLFRTVDPPIIDNHKYDIGFFTDHLLDNDDELEYFALRYEYTGNYDVNYLKLVSEAGAVLMSWDTVEIQYNYPSYTPFTNVDGSIKLVLARQFEIDPNYYNLGIDRYEVYSFPGTLPSGILDEAPENDLFLGNPYPNPTESMISLPYELPSGVSVAKMNIIDMNGRLIQQLQVGRAFSDIKLNTSGFRAGTYRYFLLSHKGKSTHQSFVVQ